MSTSDPHFENRKYSMVRRETTSQGVVFVKYPQRDDVPRSLVLARLATEVVVMQRLSQCSEFHEPLGAVELVDVDLPTGRIVTQEAPGEMLTRHLLSRDVRPDMFRALYLTGKWLQVFQSVRVDDIQFVRGPTNPEDLIEFCDFRLRIIKNLGSEWPSETTRGRLLSWMSRRISETPQSYFKKVANHGDYGPHNILWNGKKLTPIDFENCGADFSLLDLTYFIHRLEMLPIQFPWKSWPAQRWSAAVQQGFGIPNVQNIPLFEVLMVRHFLARYKKSLDRHDCSRRQNFHNTWVRRCLRRSITKRIAQ